MGSELWLAPTLALALLYEERAKGLRSLSVGIVLAAGASVGCYSDVAVTLIGAFCALVACLLGTWYWSGARAWKVLSILVSSGLVLAFYAERIGHHAILGNIILLLAAIGIAHDLTHRLNRTIIVAAFAALLVFDVYAVWFSDLMCRIAHPVPDVFPRGILAMALEPARDYLGAGDVIFAALGVVTVHVHAGVRRSWIAAAFIAFFLWLFAFEPFLNMLPKQLNEYFSVFPAMLVIAPIILVSFVRSHRRPACS